MSKKKTIIAHDELRGFHKIIHENSKIEYVRPSKLAELKKDKSIKVVGFVEEEKDKVLSKSADKKDNESKTNTEEDKKSSTIEQQLEAMPQNELVALATRLGMDSAKPNTSKVDLKKYILENNK